MLQLNLQHTITLLISEHIVQAWKEKDSRGIIEDARLEDLSHFESCLERIYQLGGILPNDATAFIKMSGCEFLQLPANPTDHKAILENA